MAQANIYPVNFNVAAFQNALQQTGNGELGGYFGTQAVMGRPTAMGRPFNGIVWISATWPGSTSGFSPSGQPSPYPAQGNVSDSQQINPAVAGAQQQALPYPLCSASLGGTAFDLLVANNRFKIPSCASGVGYPNAIRLHDASNLNPTALTNGNGASGLSIVSNLPVYIMGDYNSSSNVSSATSTPWVSSLVAGDQIAMLSNAWDDANDSWSGIQEPNGITTTVNSAFITGMMQTDATNSNKYHAIPQFLENWSGNFNFNGSMVVGYYPVYQISPISNKGYGPPNRNFHYDPHFAETVNQPPGAFIFPVSSVNQWRKQLAGSN